MILHWNRHRSQYPQQTRKQEWFMGSLFLCTCSLFDASAILLMLTFGSTSDCTWL
jgi:hypothetical protein